MESSSSSSSSFGSLESRTAWTTMGEVINLLADSLESVSTAERSPQGADVGYIAVAVAGP